MPSTNATSGVPIPLDADPVRDGAKATRDIVALMPYVMGPTPGLFGSWQAAKPMVFVVQRITQTSNQYGQLYVAFPKSLNYVAGAWVMGLASGAVSYDVDMTNPPTAAGIIIRVMNPQGGAMLPNRPCDISILTIGQ